MNKTAFVSLLAVGALAAATIGLSIANSSTTSAAASGGTDPEMTVALSPRFSTAQVTADRLPGFLVEGVQALPGLTSSSVRLLGEREGVKFWLGTNDDGETCLVSLQPGGDQLASMTCQGAEAVWKQGLALQVDTASGSVRAYFLPAGYTASIPGYDLVGGQLHVGNPQTESAPIPVARPEADDHHAHQQRGQLRNGCFPAPPDAGSLDGFRPMNAQARVRAEAQLRASSAGFHGLRRVGTGASGAPSIAISSLI